MSTPNLGEFFTLPPAIDGHGVVQPFYAWWGQGVGSLQGADVFCFAPLKTGILADGISAVCTRIPVSEPPLWMLQTAALATVGVVVGVKKWMISRSQD